MSSYQIRYNHKSVFFTKDGRYRGGVRCEQMPILEPRFDPAKEDRENRRKVVKEIIKLVKNGEKLEDVCDRMVEKYKNDFKYLPLENLPQIFANWYNGAIREKKEFEKGLEYYAK